MKKTSLRRVSHVVNILTQHGLGHFVQKYKLTKHLPFLKRLTIETSRTEDIPVRLRKAMEELGGAYLKLGQLLSLRPDLVPPTWCEEFKKLLDQTTPATYEQIKPIIEKELKKPIHKLFSKFDKKPIGSASIAQVHLARLHTGQKVVVKVQRPKTKEKFESDITLLYYLARKIDKYIVNHASPLDIVEEFDRYTKKELDFTNEARNADRFCKNFKNHTKVKIPKIYWQYTKPQVLVMQYFDGEKLSKAKLKKTQKPKIAKIIADSVFKQAMEDGFFHADMHPGNILILPKGNIALLDFGIVCELDPTLRKLELEMYIAIVNKDVRQVIRILLKEGMPTEETDLQAFAIDSENILEEWYSAELKAARITSMMHHLFNNCVAHKIKMPVNLILFGKGMLTAEGTCLYVNPEFDFLSFSRPKIANLLKKQKRPAKLIKSFMDKSKDFAFKLADLPDEALDVLEKIKHGAIKVDMAYTDVRHVGMDINKSSNRLSYSLIIAALIVAGALLIDMQPSFYGYSIFTIVSIFGAGVLLVMLFVSVLREGSSKYDPHKKWKPKR
ncbi:AarF/ABC1/UbiB kinase family protein [Candidatus Woesearchaeota archaeon]|nr:AarF/ABC1/UbiB kinase family protein [Candidatus Woesearchaeota archaeon]